MRRAHHPCASIQKIRDVIGKGGVTIRSITEETGATIDITDDGVVKIAAVDKAAGDEARRRIEQITADVEVGQIYEGKVVRIMDFRRVRGHSARPGWDGAYFPDLRGARAERERQTGGWRCGQGPGAGN